MAKAKPENRETDERTFKSLMDVLRYLQDRDYQIEKTKLYQDKDERLIRVEKKKPIPESEVLAYIVRAGLQKISEVRPEEVDRSTQEKRNKEIKNLDIKNKFDELRLEREMGKLIPRASAERRQAEMLMVMDTSFRELIDMELHDLCAMLCGDQKKLNDAKDHMEGKWDEMMNKLARTDSFVMLVEADND